ncbi:ankyrin repeat-containing domain protein [Ustulina deusta]|nr:ankyrin repeat-containing domain protein [Ustulina deusta]
MEALGAASAIITFIDVSQKLLVACYRLRGQWKDYEKHISELISEVERLSDISEELQEIVDDADGQKALSQLSLPPGTASKGHSSALTACRSVLEACAPVLEDLSNKLTPLRRACFRDKLKWPFNSGNIAKKIEFIRNQKLTLELALSTYQTRLIATQSRKTEDRYLKEKRGALLRWFKTSNPEQNHLTSRESHEPGTGQWIFENAAFKTWVNDSGSLLWLHGIPGAGKTILCSTIINHLQERSSSAPRGRGSVRYHVLYYYFTFSDESKQSLANLLKFAIYQLIADNEGLPDAAAALYDSKNHGLNEPSIKELIDALTSVASSCTGNVYLLVDALDECPRKERKAFYDKALGSILAAKINLMVSSRKEPDIEHHVRSISSYEICIQNENVDADVRAHAHSVISQEPKFQAMKPSLQAEILDGIAAGAHGMFRWAVCQLEVIKECLTPAMVRERLKTMPKDLDQTYDRILYGIPASHRPFVQSALRWLVFSARPLLLEELAEATVIQPGEPFDPDSSRLLSQNMIIDLCGVLVSSSTISQYRTQWLGYKIYCENRGYYECMEATYVVITLSHYSVKEYLTSRSLQCGALSSFCTSILLCNSYVSQCCLTYILAFNGGTFTRAFTPDVFHEYPLLQYACRYWMTHWENASAGEEDPLLQTLVENLFQLDAPEAYANWVNVWDSCGNRGSLAPLANSVDLCPQTLYWASSLGHMALVKLLVEKGAEINKAEGYYGSAFGASVFHGHLSIVDFFLQRGANLSLHVPSVGGVLQIAVLGGHYEVIKYLIIERGVDINPPSEERKTPLIEAILKQRHDIVNLLLSQGADVGPISPSTDIPLYHAASVGDSSLVAKLLEAGANVNNADDDFRRTPLSGAVQSGSIALVRALIQKGADVNKPRNILTCPFIEAVEIGHVEMVQALLEAGANYHTSYHISRRALEISIEKRHTAIFHILLDAAADTNEVGRKYEGLLATALLFEEFSIARTLMERGIVDYDALAVVAATKIHKAQPYFLEDILQDSNIDINAQARYFRHEFGSPLHIAIEEEDENAIWAILRRNPDVNIIQRESGLTPLSLAISRGMSDIAEELIRRGADINQNSSWSPFEMAVRHACVSTDGSLSMANLLLDRGVKINEGNENAVWWPLQMNKYSIMEYLVSRGMDLNQVMRTRPAHSIPDSDVPALTPMQYAALKGDLKTIEFLFNLDASLHGPLGGQETALIHSLRSNNPLAAEFLLDHGAIPDTADGHSALHIAITRGFSTLVPVLLRHGADVNANEMGESPLAAAVRAKDDLLAPLLMKLGAHFLLSDQRILCDTIRHGTIEDLKKLFHMGLSPDASDSHNCGIAEAILTGNKEALELLIEVGANIYKKRHQYLLQQVCQSGDMKVAAILLDNSCDFEPSSALAAAVGVANNYKIVKMLLERGANVSGDCFANAINAGAEMLSLLLDLPMTPSQRREYLGRALQSAAYVRHYSVCKWLIDDCGADVNYGGALHGTALQAALESAASRHFDENEVLIEMLLSRGANANPPSMDEELEGDDLSEPKLTLLTHTSPISQALMIQHTPKAKYLVSMLLAHGADINLTGGEYHTPLQVAARFHPCMLEYILDAGADINAVGGAFGTALHAAAFRGEFEGVKLLLSHGADARIIAGKHGSVLHSAVYRCPSPFSSKHHRQILDLLLEAGADVNFQYGPAVQAAVVGGNLEALKWLVENGADVRARGGKWGNVYRAACRNISNEGGVVPWDIVSWLEFHYGRDGWEDDTKD